MFLIAEKAHLQGRSVPPVVVERVNKVQQLCDYANADAELLGVVPVERQASLLPLDNGNQAITTLLEDDPLIKQGIMHVPTEQLRNMEKLRDAGADFDELIISHEIEPLFDESKGARPLTGREVELYDRSASLPAQQEARKMNEAAAASLQAVGGALKSTPAIVGIGAGVGTAAVGGSMLAILGAMATLDPIIFGLISESGEAEQGEPAALIKIAQWDW